MTNLTKEEIQKRLEAIEMDDYNDIKTMKEFISDIIDSIVPEKKTGIRILDPDDDYYCIECGGYDECDCTGFNEAIDTIHKNKKELLG